MRDELDEDEDDEMREMSSSVFFSLLSDEGLPDREDREDMSDAGAKKDEEGRVVESMESRRSTFDGVIILEEEEEEERVCR